MIPNGSQKKKTVIFFAKVKKDFFSSWEYYSNDIYILRECYDKVIICHGYSKVFIELIINRNADLFCWWWHSSAPVILFARLFGFKTFCTGAIHMFDCSGAPDFYSRSLFYRLANRISLYICSCNIFISNDQFLSITTHINVRNPITLHSALPPNNLSQCPLVLANVHSRSRPITFLYFSWLSLDQVKRKGLFSIIDAFKLFVEGHDKNAILIIAGKSSDAVPLIKDRINSLALTSNVNYFFDVSEEDKGALYSRSDLLLTPSYMEGFGNATLEAMSYGCPSLVSSYGASKEVVANTGFIIHSIDAKSILEVLIIYKSIDYQQRNYLRKLAFNRAHTQFSFQARVRQFNAILSKNEAIPR